VGIRKVDLVKKVELGKGINESLTTIGESNE
jgi:hypothetical protein